MEENLMENAVDCGSVFNSYWFQYQFFYKNFMYITGLPK